MKFAFVTCVQLGLSCIEKIYETGGKLDLLVTLKDHKAARKSGRIYLDDFAGKHQIPLLKINHINDREVIDTLKEEEIDWLFVIGWSQIAGPEVLSAPKTGVLGIHPTLLPEGRGRAAIPWAILKGLEYTGVTMFKLSEGIDTGEIVAQLKIPLLPDETASTLYEKVNKAHEELIASVYPKLIKGEVKWEKQDETKATYWEGRKPEDGLLTGDMTVEYAERMVRAVTHPYPGAYLLCNDKKIVIWKAAISREQPAGGNYQRFKNGYLILEDFETEQISPC